MKDVFKSYKLIKKMSLSNAAIRGTKKEVKTNRMNFPFTDNDKPAS